MSANMLIKRNYTHHVYYGGWSQGSNYELSSTPTMTVENNVINDSSWPVRGVACEFRYNLVVGAGHEFLWADSNASVHHNIFVGGQSDVASLYLINNPTNVQIYNNTVDGLLYTDFVTALQITGGAAAFSSNLILNAPHPPGAAQGAAVTISGGALTTDYNAFAGPQTVDYSDGRTPAHDLSFPDASGAQLTAPPTVDFDLDEATIWNRTTSVRDILAQYRMKYLPKAGSPLVDKGDPAGGPGNDVGCVGAGTANAADLFAGGATLSPPRHAERVTMRGGEIMRPSLHAFLGGVLSVMAVGGAARPAAPPTPSGPHPRLFMSAARTTAYAANAQVKGTAAQAMVSSCQEAIDTPKDVADRGGSDGYNWPGTAVACAFAYRATQNPAFLTTAIKDWNASLDDDQTLGDGLGCVAGASATWQTWAMSGNGPTPPLIITVTHDTGYPMRWYGPYIAPSAVTTGCTTRPASTPACCRTRARA